MTTILCCSGKLNYEQLCRYAIYALFFFDIHIHGVCVCACVGVSMGDMTGGTDTGIPDGTGNQRQ